MGDEPVGGVHRRQRLGGYVRRQPGPRLVTEGELVGGEVEVHPCSLFFCAIDLASRPPRESSDVSALCAWAKWCSPNTESMPARMPCRSSAWLTAFLVSARPKR